MASPSSRTTEFQATSSPPAYTARTWTVLLCLLMFAAGYAGFYLKRGWIPHDDGSFSLAAERVLRGELPHRDFDDLYTGGLTFLNAAAMKVVGINMAAIRYPAFLFFLAWVPAVFNIARRFTSEHAAALVTLLAIATSFPNYPSAVPSWYNLFFATFGVLALFRFSENLCRNWLLLAGLCAGLSFLAKLSGLYFLAATLLFVVHREQDLDRLDDHRPKLTAVSIFVFICCVAFVLVLLKLINWSHDPRYLIHFVLPGAALVIVLAWRELTFSYAPPRRRFALLLTDSAWIFAGFAIPVLILLVPYVASGSLHSWIEGVFILPARRLTFASREPASLKWVNLLAPALLVYGLVAVQQIRRPLGTIARTAISVLLAAAVIVSGFQKGTYHFLWFALVLLVPFTTVLIALSKKTNAYVFALTATAAMCSLVQYPYAAPIYLLYALPLMALVWAAFLNANAVHSRFLPVAIACTYLAFFVLRVTPSYINAMGLYYTGLQPVTTLNLPATGGIRVDPQQASQYEQVIAIIQQHRRGDYTYAAIDAPEIYFLSGLRSTSRSLFDFFENSPDRDQKTLAALSSYGVNVITIKTPEETGPGKLGTPSFSQALDPPLLSELRKRYPHSQKIGNFEVRWNQ